MKPLDFEGADTILGAPPGWDKEKHGPCEGLPIMRRDGVCISCWKLTWREKLKVIFGGYVFCHVASGETQPPIALVAE